MRFGSTAIDSNSSGMSQIGKLSFSVEETRPNGIMKWKWQDVPGRDECFNCVVHALVNLVYFLIGAFGFSIGDA